MKKEKTLKINLPILIISFIILTISIIINNSHAIRPILWIISIILLSLNIGLSNKNKTSHIIIMILFLFIISLFIDSILVYTFKRIPVFSYNIITTKKTVVYNSLGMRVWQCNKDDYNDLIIDAFYQKGYMCDAKDIDAIDSNSFLNSIVVNYNEYKNNYVKIRGKISKKTGQNYIEMRPYENTEITVNGYVAFTDNITLRIIFKENEPLLDNYDIYDEITIVGIVKNLENESNKHIVYMYDSKVIGNINLNEYVITATQETKCSKEVEPIFNNEQNNVYTYCLAEIIVSYPKNKYELASSLSSNKITVKEIYTNPLSIETREEDNSKIYRFDDYSVLVCDEELSKDIFIGYKKMKFKDVQCQLKVES